MKAMTEAVLQFPMAFTKNLAETQVEYLNHAEEHLKGLGLPPAMLFFSLEALKAWKRAVQTPAVFFGHQEHFRH